MYQSILFLSISRDMCEKGEVLDADESYTWIRSSYTSLLLREASSCTSVCQTHRTFAHLFFQKEQMETRTAALPSEETDRGGHGYSPSWSSRTARAYAKTYTMEPLLIPAILVERIMAYIGHVILRQKREFVLLLCRYWRLKHEAWRGASLLKRLHLEPWTASAGGRQQTEDEKVLKLEVRHYLCRSLFIFIVM